MRIQNKIMLGAVIFVLCTAAAYAQIGISSIPQTEVRNTGRAELGGTVRVTAGTSGTVAGDTFTISYGVPITNDFTHGIVLNDAGTPGVTGASWPVGCTPTITDYLHGVITITGCPAAAANQFFQISYVRFSVDGGPGSVTALIGSVLNPIIANQQSAVVIESAGTGLVSGGTGTGMVILANTIQIPNAPSASAFGRLFLKEGFPGAWKTLTDEGVGATQATQILLTIAGLPTGVTVVPSICAAATSCNGATSLTSSTISATLSSAAITSISPTSTITITAESLSAIETLEVDFTVTVGSGATLPLAAAVFPVNATLTPNDPALNATNSGPGLSAAGIYHAPRFSVSNVSQTALTIVPNTTNLLIPYASTSAGYHTGIAIANTTTDPFGPPGTAIPQKGPITFYFYPQAATKTSTAGTPSVYVTGANDPGTGLDSNGNLLSGSTYTVLIDQLLPLATPALPATGFAGYVIAIVQVNDCHGLAFTSDFNGKFSSYSPALVIPNTIAVPRAIQLPGELLDQ